MKYWRELCFMSSKIKWREWFNSEHLILVDVISELKRWWAIATAAKGAFSKAYDLMSLCCFIAGLGTVTWVFFSASVIFMFFLDMHIFQDSLWERKSKACMGSSWTESEDSLCHGFQITGTPAGFYLLFLGQKAKKQCYQLLNFSFFMLIFICLFIKSYHL